MSEATFTFRVDEALKNEFADAAKARDRTGAQLLRDFMRQYVKAQSEESYDAWLRESVTRAKASADAGDLVSSAEVEAYFAAKRKASLERGKSAK